MAKETYTAKNGLTSFQNGVRLSSRTLAFNDNSRFKDAERAVARRTIQLATRYATDENGMISPERYTRSRAYRVGDRLLSRLAIKS